VCIAVLLAALAVRAKADELHVMISGGFTGAYQAILPAYEKQASVKLLTAYGPSMGETPQAIPNRLARGESADVVIMARSALDTLVKNGFVLPGSEVDIVRSKVALAVKAGAPVPDISSAEALKSALLRANSVAWSDSASGQYVSKELFHRLGIEAAMAAKGKMIPATPVGVIVARGEAEIGFQQLSELLAVEGITVVGPIPEAVQTITIFSAGVTKASKSPEAAKRLIDYLASPQAWPSIRRYGLEPVSAPVVAAAP